MITTIEDFQDYVPVNSNTSFRLLAGKMKYVKKKFLVPILGKELLTAIETSTDDEWEEIRTCYETIVTNWAFVLAIPFIEVQVGDSGITRPAGPNLETAYAKQIVALKSAAQDTALDELEDMFRILDLNIETLFTLWPAAPGYASNKTYFLQSSKDLAESYPMPRPALTFRMLVSLQAETEMLYIRPVLGNALFDLLKVKIAGTGTISAQEKKCIQQVKYAVGKFLVHEALATNTLQLTPEGFQVSSYDSLSSYDPSTPAAVSLLASTKAQLRDRGERILNNIITELILKYPADFPAYYADASVINKTGESTFNPQIGGLFVAK
jgi:hypothetical protein